MCGICAYIGEKEAFPILKEGLKRIEYRGYDSAGIAVLEKEIKVNKDVGKIEEALKEELEGKIGIAHTRWATHGGVSKENAHPQFDCFNNIAIVHNGVIENVEELREKLRNHKIRSETDTELIAHLIEEELKTKLPMEAIRSALLELKGSYAFALLIKGEDKIYFAKKDSPLIVGIGKGEMFLGSDVAAFLKHTNDVIYLEDYDFGYISKDREAIFNALSGKKASRRAVKVSFSPEDVEKGEYEYFMLKEIEEQGYRITDMLNSNTKDLERAIEEFDRIHIIGAGTSYHAARMLKYLLEREKGIESDVMISSEYKFFKRPDKNTLVIAFSQSGETADTLKAVKFAKERNAKIGVITNIRGSSLDRISDYSVYLNAGLEVGVAATKTFLAQLVITYKLSKRIDGEEIKRIINYSLREENKQVVKKFSKEIANKEHVFYLGRGLNFPLAMEGSLKLKEITYIHSEAYPAGELKHGPISLIDEDSLAIFLVPKDETYEKTLSNIQEVRARGAKTILLSDVALDNSINIAKPKDPLYYPFAELIPLQLLAYYTARERGLDTDKPRNLAKSVTVE